MADLAVADISKSEAIERLNRFKHTMAKAREHAKAAGRRTVTGLVTLGGGVAAAVVDSKVPTVPGFPEVPTNFVLGGLSFLLGVSGYLDEHSDNACAFGVGLLTPTVYAKTVQALHK